MKGHYCRISEPCGRRRWRIVRERMPQNQHERTWGDCDHDRRTITLHDSQTPLELLGTIIHESTHGACPEFSESLIVRIEQSAVSALLPFLLEIAEYVIDNKEEIKCLR